MDGVKPGCPSDMTLEAYIYEDLSYMQKIKVRVHLAFCCSCRKRLLDLRSFNKMLAEIPNEELPSGFLDNVLQSMDEWGDPTPVAAEEEEDQVIVGPDMKVRWALGTLMFLVSGLIQWKYADYLPGFLSSGYLTGLKGLAEFWQYVRSGAWWQSVLQVIAAVRTDGLGALEILGDSLPTQIAGVVVFGGIVTAVFISQLKASRGKREGHRR
ncbi:MAG: hypothetical protein ACM3WU_04825 [Bacillota bacterium]